MIKTKHVKTIQVVDPDSGGIVEVEIRKMETGAMVGIDGSFLEQDVGEVYSPYDGYDAALQLEIPDDEEPESVEVVIDKVSCHLRNLFIQHEVTEDGKCIKVNRDSLVQYSTDLFRMDEDYDESEANKCLMECLNVHFNHRFNFVHKTDDWMLLEIVK
jgi:hypothetical protein